MTPAANTNFSYQLLIILFFRQFIEFMRLVWGCINKPYETYRKLSHYTYHYQVVFLLFLLLFYALTVGTIKAGIHNGVLNIAFKSGEITFTSIVSYFFSVFILYSAARFLKGNGSLLNIATLWAFSLLPTLVWFLGSSFSYFLLPPPRTPSLPGQFFSAIFIAFSLGCLIWKCILYYLTLRFGMKLDALKILLVTTLVTPIFMMYSLLFYKLGIFKVPFI